MRIYPCLSFGEDGSGYTSNSKFRAVEAQNRAVVADLHDFNEEQDSDLNPHQSKLSDPDPTQFEKKTRIQIRLIVFRI